MHGLTKNDLHPEENIYRFSYNSKSNNPHINAKTSGSRYHRISFPEIEANLNVIRTTDFQLSYKNRFVGPSLTLVATPNNKQSIKILGGSSNF